MNHLKTFSSYFINESVDIEKMEFEAYDNITVTKLPYSSYIEDNKTSFLKKITAISKDLGINPIWLMHTIYFYSEFDPKKTDNVAGTVGLITFAPDVAKLFINQDKGKTIITNDIYNMDNLEQLDLVKTYYKMWFDKLGIKSPKAGDFAAVTFYPGAIKKKDNWEFPDYVVSRNMDLFNAIGTDMEKNKENYYEYMENILNSEKEFKDKKGIELGYTSGAIMNPYDYEIKDDDDFYVDLVYSMEDPISRNSEGEEKEDEQREEDPNTEKAKQVDK
jgi:hypothetical protein